MDLWVRIPLHLPYLRYNMSKIDKLRHHLSHLQEKHNILEDKIRDAYDHYDADSIVKILKIEKLKVKLEIEECENKIAVGAVLESQDPHKVS